MAPRGGGAGGLEIAVRALGSKERRPTLLFKSAAMSVSIFVSSAAVTFVCGAPNVLPQTIFA